MITFLELRIQKKSEKRPQKWARNSDPFLVPLSIGIFPEGSENGRILGPAFWCWRTTFELIFGIAQSGRGASISSATCSRRTPKCSQLMLALNTYSFQTIKLKLAAFLPSAAPTVGLLHSAVFSANPARTCADPSIELRNQAVFSGKSQPSYHCMGRGFEYVSFRGPLGSLQVTPNSTETKQARSTLFSLLFFSSPSLEPSRARLEASVHSSLDLKHSTA